MVARQTPLKYLLTSILLFSLTFAAAELAKIPDK